MRGEGAPTPGSTSNSAQTSLIEQAQALEAPYAPKGIARQSPFPETITERMREVISDALVAGDPVSEASFDDFHSFMLHVPFGRRPSIYLLDNGNFRAVWKNADNEQAAFQFRGHGIVQCVFFFKRESPLLPLNRETLIDTMPRVRARFKDFEHLIKESDPFPKTA